MFVADCEILGFDAEGVRGGIVTGILEEVSYVMRASVGERCASGRFDCWI